MKKSFLFFSIMAMFALALAGGAFAQTSSSTCTLTTTMVNQDPYPAVPGETVKVVFQVDGVENINCGDVRVTLIEEYPFTLDQGSQKTVSVEGGTFVRDYPSFLLAPYTLRVDKDAIDGENTISLEIYNQRTGGTIVEDFTIEVQEVRTDFEVFIRSYDTVEGLLTLEVINIGKSDVDSVVVELPSQDTISVRGASRQTIGVLDSNEDTTTRFGILSAEEGELTVNIRYNDAIGERREITRNIYFDPSSFESAGNGEGLSLSTYLLIIIVIAVIAYWFYARYKRKKKLRRKS